MKFLDDFTLQEQRLLVAFCYHVLMAVLALAGLLLGLWLEAGALAEAGILLGLAHLLTFRRIPIDRVIQEKLVRTTRCPECSQHFSLSARFRCSCGFVGRRHVFGRCHCGRGASWVVCPHCSNGLPI